VVQRALDANDARRHDAHDRPRQARQLRGLLIGRDRAGAELQRRPYGTACERLQQLVAPLVRRQHRVARGGIVSLGCEECTT